MLVNHAAKEFLKSVHTEALFSQLFVQTLSSYFRVLPSFFEIFFGSNQYKWLVLELVRCPWKTDNLRATLMCTC